MKKTFVIVAALLLALVALPVVAQAQPQTAVNPRTVCFVPSPDHSRIGIDGQAAVVRYELRLFQQGATSPFTTQDLGKPTPGTDGQICVTNRSWFAMSLNGQLCFARVATIGPSGYGEAESSNSNPFGNEGVGPTGPPIIKQSEDATGVTTGMQN